MSDAAPDLLAAYAPACLAGHHVLITGGGTGIGRGIASAYLRLGAEVAIMSRKADVLALAQAEMLAAHGRQVVTIAADVREPEALAAASDHLRERWGQLDTLINSAAGNFLAPAATLSANALRTVVDIDLVGTFNACNATRALLAASGRGLIVNLSATLQLHGTPLQLHAAAAKAGIDSLTRTLAVEWAGLGIRVNGIAPGPIDDTEGMRRLAPGDVGAKLRASIPLGRFGAIDEIAATAVFLRTRGAGYINGTTLIVDGGQTVQPARVW